MVIEAKVSEQKWRYTWESQSHTPTLRLLLFPFSKTLNPSLNLTVHLHSPPSFLTLTSTSVALSLRVPIPNVLLDADFPPTVRSFTDHIEVKLLLLLPVDHPALSALHQSSPLPQPLLMEYDVDKLSSAEEVEFVCRSCGHGLTKKPIRYVNSYACAQGMCLLSSTSVTFCKDDLVGSDFPEPCGQLHECSYIADDFGGVSVSEGTGNFGLNEERTSTCYDAGEANGAFDENARVSHPENGQRSVNFNEVAKNEPDCSGFARICLDLNDTKDGTNIPSCCTPTSTLGDEDGEHARKIETVEIVGNQKTFLNGFLEDIFMARSSNLSKDIYWHEFICPQCTTLLGAYPCCEGCAPVDGGVRLFKCYISTCVPVLGSGDIFSKYTVDKMFANQLMECANDESTFRTEDKDPDPKLQLRPVIKVLFSDSKPATESQLRMIEEWAAKNSAEDIFMLTYQIQDLVDALMSAKDMYPPSCASLHGLILSSLQR
ncbi:hypothetical protein TSUD_210790 [Trifolium subterraneum]|uniref:Uncharacterized protein n=1 Tax=Trifolium subterraneum TaxID=3900 RepID=A0A2Z6N2L5_TRISU|nr:hypothetical protein TSUD_210790 [Trifolium subterraneum]